MTHTPSVLGADVVAQVGGWDHNDTNVFNRELSWLAFNARVLQLSSDTEVPLLEQIRFLAIFSSNLDEFFQVRVSGLRDQQAAGISTPASDGRLPAEQLALVRDIVTALVAEQERVLVHEIMPALREQGIELSAWHELDADDQAELSERFRDRIFSVLTPLAVDPGHPFPYVSDLSLNLAVVVRDPRDDRELFARVKVPNTLPRWLRIDDTDRFVPLEEVIAAHLDQLTALAALRPLMLEQPFPPGRLDLDQQLKARAPTLPLCLDESLTDLGAFYTADALGVLDAANIKPGRVGGQLVRWQANESILAEASIHETNSRLLWIHCKQLGTM